MTSQRNLLVPLAVGTLLILQIAVRALLLMRGAQQDIRSSGDVLGCERDQSHNPKLLRPYSERCATAPITFRESV